MADNFYKNFILYFYNRERIKGKVTHLNILVKLIIKEFPNGVRKQKRSEYPIIINQNFQDFSSSFHNIYAP